MKNLSLKKIITTIAFVIPTMVNAAGGGATFPNDDIDIDWSDKASMQRGAQIFSNYCLTCHSAEYSRYNRVGADLGISDELVLENLVFTTDKFGEKTKVGELMKTTMTKEYAEEAFGTAPPDLTLIARSKGTHYLYNYLRGFYIDDSRPMGMNNGVFANVGMPHVLIDLEGTKKAIWEVQEDSDGNKAKVIVGFEQVTEGSRTTAEFDADVHDLVAFLDYMAEPYKEKRRSVGVGVLIFLSFLLVLAYLLKKEYWKDIH